VNTIRFSQLFYLGLGLLPLGLIIPARSESSIPAAPMAEPADQLPAPAKTVAEWQAQIAQAQVTVIQVTLTSTPAGLEIRLDTADNKPLQIDASKFRQDSNAFVAEIPNTSLALSDGQPFSAINPTADVASVQVSETVPGTVQVRVTGNNAPPKTDITLKTGALIYGLNPTTGDDEEEELIVTGATAGYTVPSATVGTKTDIPLRDVPQSIQVVPQQVLKDQGVIELADALRNVSGVIGSGNSIGGDDSFYIIRGFEDFDSILQNGFGSKSVAFLGGNTTNVEQVEVLKGPASVLYGQGEVGGIINLVPKKPLSKPYYNIEAVIGNFAFYRPSIDLSGPLNTDKTILYRLNASYESAGSFVDFINSQDLAIFPVVSFRLSEATTIKINGSYQKSAIDSYPGLPAVGTVLPNRNGNIPLSSYLSFPELESEERTGFGIGYELKHNFSRNWSIRNTFQAEFVDNPGTSKPSGTGLTLREDDRTADVSFFGGSGARQSYQLQTEFIGKIQTGSIKHDLLLGLDLRRVTGTNTNGFFETRDGSELTLDVFNPQQAGELPELDYVKDFDASIQDDFVGIYAQNLISFGEKLKILLGGRLDWVKQKYDDNLNDAFDVISRDSAFSPRVGIVYQPIKPISLYAAYNRSFKAEGGFGNVNADNKPFEPTTGEQFEVGVKAELLDGKLAATLAAYQITKRNVIVDDPERPDFSIQIGAQRSRGFEFDLSGEPIPGLRLIATYAYTDAKVTEDTTTLRGNQVSNVPQHSGSLWAVYEIQKGNLKGFGIGAGVFVLGDRPGDLENSFNLPSYGRTDALLYYRQNRWRAQLNFQNIFNVNYFESSFGRDNVYPGAPFTVRGTISVTF
jgi:iron complex outermembrane recepter protein